MVINDKLKGAYYRAPLTKLASRTLVENQINELIEYYNLISTRLNECFDDISDSKIKMKEILAKIYEKTLHFKYIIEHFHLEVDQHIEERLNYTINHFTSSITEFITPYDSNLFNHAGLTDENIAVSATTETLEEWDRSVNTISTELGIRWFGGKISDKSLYNQLHNVLHITKLNTYEGKNNEDYSNSNLILELFIYSNKGMAWLVLGQNSTFGYNMIVKYQSPNFDLKLKLGSELYNNKKDHPLNVIDFDLILESLSKSESSGDIYVKVCTNIPANSESGRESYFATSENIFNSYEFRKSIIDYGNGLLYHDNKDLAYRQHDDTYLKMISQMNFPKITTVNLISPISSKTNALNTDSETELYYSTITAIPTENNRVDYQQQVINPNNERMTDLADITSGIVVDNSSTIVNKGFLQENKTNKELIDSPKYEKGEQIVNLSDHRTTGTVSLLVNNDTMFKIDSLNSSQKVIENDQEIGKNVKETSIVTKLSNNEIFDVLNKDEIYENISTVVGSLTDEKITTMLQVDHTVLIGTDKHLYVLKNGKYFLISILDHRINSFIRTSANMIFIGTSQGIYRYYPNSETVAISNIIDGNIHSFFEGDDGLIYAFKTVTASDVYIRDATQSYAAGKISIKDFEYVYLNGNWYDINDFCANVLHTSDMNLSTFESEDIASSFVDPVKLDWNKQTYQFMFSKVNNQVKILINKEDGSSIIVTCTPTLIDGKKYYIGKFAIENSEEKAKYIINYKKNTIISSISEQSNDKIIGKYISEDLLTSKELTKNKIELIINNRNKIIPIKILYSIDDIKTFKVYNTEEIDYETSKKLPIGIIKNINNNLFIIPKNSTQYLGDIIDIIFVNGFYYIQTNVDRVYKVDENFNTVGILYIKDLQNIFSTGNLLILSDGINLYTDNESQKHYSGFINKLSSEDNRITVNMLQK